jgi:hypothetical protein
LFSYIYIDGKSFGGKQMGPHDVIKEKSLSQWIYLRPAPVENSRKILLDREFYDIINQC